MGMDVGAKGSSMATMNVVPLIDILLVLIIIFMVITPLTPQGLPALIPQPAKTITPNPETPINTIVVQVLDTGKLKVNEEDATWDSLGSRLADVFKERAEKVAFVQGRRRCKVLRSCARCRYLAQLRHRKSWVDDCEA